MADEIEAQNQGYFSLVQLLLLDFQFIEEALKMYIATAYEIIRLRTRDFMPFELSYDTVAQESFGRLVSRYASLTDNKPLVSARMRDRVRSLPRIDGRSGAKFEGPRRT